MFFFALDDPSGVPFPPFFLPKLYYEDRETETANCNAYFVIRRLFLTTSLLFVHFLFEPFFFS